MLVLHELPPYCNHLIPPPMQVLDHFTNLAILLVADQKRHRFVLLKRSVVCFVILCNTVGLIAVLFGAASLHQQASDRLLLAAMIRNKAPQSDITAFGAQLDSDYANKVALSLSIQYCFDAIVLILLILCYLITLSYTLRLATVTRIATENVGLIAMHAGRTTVVANAEHQALMTQMTQSLKRRIVATVVIIFFALVVAVTSAVIFAAANVGFEYNSSPECGGAFPTGQCWPCQPTGQLMKSWLRFTPEFHAVVVLISSPLTLTLAMWGMLGRKDRLALRGGEDETEESSARLKSLSMTQSKYADDDDDVSHLSRDVRDSRISI